MSPSGIQECKNKMHSVRRDAMDSGHQQLKSIETEQSINLAFIECLLQCREKMLRYYLSVRIYTFEGEGGNIKLNDI